MSIARHSVDIFSATRSIKWPSPAPISAMVCGGFAENTRMSSRATSVLFVINALMRRKSRRERMARGSSGGSSSSHSGSLVRGMFMPAFVPALVAQYR